MIRLKGAACDERLRALVACVRQEEFQFACFVAAQCESGLIVALNQQTWAR
jgi:hypothetical protein